MKTLQQLFFGILLIVGMAAALFFSQKYFGKQKAEPAYQTEKQSYRLEKIAKGIRDK